MTDTEALTNSSNYTQYLTLVHTDSFDKDEGNDNQSTNAAAADNLANGEYTLSHFAISTGLQGAYLHTSIVYIQIVAHVTCWLCIYVGEAFMTYNVIVWWLL